jgi:spore coat protein U-like protein
MGAIARCDAMKWKAVFAILVAFAGCTMARYASANTCSWVSITPCSFGTYNPSLSTNTTTTGALIFTCNTSGSVTLRLDGGSSGNYAARTFTGSAYTYNIYWDSTHTQVAGNDVAHEDTFTATGGTQTITTYCSMTADQNMPSGSYTDACTAHLVYGASNKTSTENVSATVTKSCSASIATNLVFGAYDPIVTNKTVALNGAATASVTCTSTVPYVVTAGQGTFPGSGSTDAAPVRQMANGTNRLGYSIYQNSGRTIALGNTAGTGLAGTGSGGAQTVTLYGQIPAGLNEPSGTYTDTVILSVTY